MLEDVVHGVRAARRNPGFATAAVLLVALGVGVNTAVFTAARALVLRPMPVRQPDRLVSIWRQSIMTGTAFGASWPNLAEWKERQRLFEGIEAYMEGREFAWLAGSGQDGGIVSEFRVTEGYFALLGVGVIQGRMFTHDELLPEAGYNTAGPVIVSYEFWQQRLGGEDPLGRTLRIGAGNGTIIGVLPRGFRVLRNDLPEIFSPLRPFPGHLQDRSMTYLEIVARLKPGVDLPRARAELAAYSQRSGQEHPRTDGGLACRVDPLHEHLFGSNRPAITVLVASAGLVLLIASSNLAILFLVRASRRRRDIAIRAALGAGRLRIVRQFLTESLVLALAGGAAGLLLAAWIADLFAAFSIQAGLGLPALRMDGAVFAFAFLVASASGALFGAAPVWHFWRADPVAVFRSAPACAPGRGFARFAVGTISVAEIALSTVLLIGAGLLLRTFLRVNDVDPGFRTQQVFAVSVGRAPFAPGARRAEAAFWSRLLDRASSLPGVHSAAFAGTLPLATRQSPENMKARVAPAGRQLPPPGFVQAEYQDVSPEFFRTMGIPFRGGRTFRDSAADAWAAVINESFAREFWAGEDPLGRQIAVSGGRPYTIVGVVGDVKEYNLRAAPPKRQIYRLLWREDVATLSRWPSQYLVVNSPYAPERLAPILKDVIASIDSGRPVIAARSMRDIALASTAWEQLKVVVVGLFGATALLLTVAGTYAVVAHSIAQRRRDIGIRIALGGRPADIRRMVLRQGMTLALAGLAAGLLAALLLAPLFTDQLFEVAPTDLATFAAAALLLGGTALAACYVPARQATRVDPAAVLRSE